MGDEKLSVSLKHHIERIIEEKESKNKLLYEQTDKALKKSADELERRLEGLNELRKEVEKDRSQFVKADSYKLEMDNARKEIKLLTDKLNIMEGKHDTKTRYMLFGLVLNFILAVAYLILLMTK
jgi:DNA repair exonuclease SbcCD ATPase subunit